MKSVEAQKLLDTIDETINNISSFSISDQKELSYLAKFLAVYICGIYEEVIEIIINEKVARLGDIAIANFTKKTLDRTFRNPDMTNILNLLKQFNCGWNHSIASLDNQYKTALDSIVTHKNSIAHGSPSTVTIIDMKTYYQDSKIVIEKIDEIIL
jgi:hypothetical protein